ncbi:MAG: hypothetical protein CMA87_05015 [Euryarchaeota archaeon]|nr:hypothetical protein [Euryarchaeota archaeon]MEC7694857.1 hypothetical protein [Candidatus Thermoplasmatota archaeon]
MSEKDEAEWRHLSAAAAILIFDALFLGMAPEGPWEDSGFSRGLIGIAGLALAYVAWYRFTFRRKGLIPWLDLWENPERTAKLEMAAAAIILFLAWAAGDPLQPFLPDPTGLVLTLVGLLIALQSAYVLLSIGPLSDDETT